MLHFTTWGTVRGSCGHAHRTLAQAQACVIRDERLCRRTGRDTDRAIRFVAFRNHFGQPRHGSRPHAA